MRNLPAAALAVLAAAGFAHPALAAWPHASAVNVAVSSAANNQQFPSIAPDGAGGAFVVWQDGRAGADDIYVQHLTALGGVDPAWPSGGLAVCTAPGYQSLAAIVADGAGGAIIAWTDDRVGTSDVYAGHVLASGVMDPAWPVNGRALCTAASDQSGVAIDADGAGGAIVAWQDSRSGAADIYAQRVLSTGTVDPAWPVNGRALCTAVLDQGNLSIVSDGAGGAVVTWQDNRGGSPADIYAQRVLSSGAVDPGWPLDGLVVCNAANVQENPELVADGSGGAIVTWDDLRTGANYDVYAQHVQAGGFVDGGWPLNGRALCTAGGSQLYPTLVSDGAGGAIVTWQDSRPGNVVDIFAQHVLASGAIDGAWPVDGRALCLAASEQLAPRIAPDGAGGAIVTWQDFRSSGFGDVYAQHVQASGVVDASWPVDGRAVCTATNLQREHVIAGDGAGGAIVAWSDFRTGGIDQYAQRIARHGVLGTPEPVIASVRDVPNDQGGRVKLSWDASWLDTDPSAVVDQYWIFRSVPAAAALAAMRGGARVHTAWSGASRLAGSLVATTTAAGTVYWEYLASHEALHILAGYSVLAATTGDSTGAYNPPTQFMVVAWNAGQTQYWASAAAGGYSVDNLAPATPAPFTGAYGGGATNLHWNPNTEPDLAGYRLYRGSSAGFVPSAGNLVAAPTDTGYADAGAAGGFFKLSAVDVHGNESGFALLSPAGTTDVAPGGGPVALSAAWPNPSRESVSLSLALPAATAVRASVLDPAGRRVRDVFHAARAAGTLRLEWDGLDASGRRCRAGLYFLRVEAGEQVFTRRIARLE